MGDGAFLNKEKNSIGTATIVRNTSANAQASTALWSVIDDVGTTLKCGLTVDLSGARADV